MAVLEASALSKRFGAVAAVDAVSFAVDEGEILTFVGPSGCGKTTSLRLVAGLEEPDAGDITYMGETVVSMSRGIFVPIHRRNMGMVFQSYAIWPHMTVRQNVAYPLRLRRVPGRELREQVDSALALVGLEGLGDRPAPLLSGGQQQRVALARALIYRPNLLLLDEPFSNLDAKLKEQMRLELKLLQRKIGVSVIFVTHDQIEALTISDKIAVMNCGQIEHLGSPQEVYRAPRTAFVLDFLGKTTMLTGRLVRTGNGRREVMIDGTDCAIVANGNAFPVAGDGPRPGSKVRVALRPEDLAVSAGTPRSAGHNVLSGTVRTIMFMGTRFEVAVELDNGALVNCYAADREMAGLAEGGPASLTFAPETTSLWPH